mgnify:CR=1 FL=1
MLASHQPTSPLPMPDSSIAHSAIAAQSNQSGPLRLYLDTAEVDAYKKWLPTGLFYGVTCNPLLLEKANVACTPSRLIALAEQACLLDCQEVHLQSWGSSPEELIKTGRTLSQANDRVVVKLPATQIGATAARVLIQEGIPVTLTAVYAVHQVLIAAALGASYAAPYLGRIKDSGKDGLAEITNMQAALNGVGSSTRLLTASIRQIEDISVLATKGVDTFTFSEAIAQSFFHQLDTDKAVADFEQAAQKMSHE